MDPLTKLRSRLTGRVLAVGQAGYERASPWNRAVDVRPQAVVAAARAQDVVETVRFAARRRLRLGVQCTGHGGVAVDADTLLVHTGDLQECMVDASRHLARVGAGVRWDQVLAASTPYGLAPVCGSAPAVGVVGYLTGGGLGPVARSLGLSSDFVRSFEVVTGDGERRRITASSDPDLFWGLRGGKSFLGIVTAVEIDLLPLSELYGGCLYFDGTAVATVLTGWRAWSASLPDHATTSLAVLRSSPSDSRTSGTRVAVRYTSLAEPTEAEEVFTPVRQLADALAGRVGTMPYARIGEVHADPTEPAAVVTGSTLLAGLTQEAVDRVVELASPRGASRQGVVELRRLGGALDRAPRGDSAYCFRSAPYHVLVSCSLGQGSSREEGDAHTGQLLSALAPWSVGTLVNFSGLGTPADVRRSYDPQSLERLSSLARRYDPGRLLSGALTPAAEARDGQRAH